MRNLKRALSLALASVMLLGMMVVGSSAAFTDADEIVNKEAVEITAGLGLFAGKEDGKFDPKGTVTRAEMATVIVKMLYGSEINADQFKGTGKFSDTAGWYEGYINLCSNMGIVSGYGDGTFLPNKKLNTAEAVTMIINALEVDAGKGDWPLTVMSKAEEMNLFDELEGAKPGTYAELSRDQLASVVLEGIKFSPSGASGWTVPSNRDVVFDNLGDAVLANSNSAAGILEKVGEDALWSTVFEVKEAEGIITANQATDADLVYTTIGTSNYNIETDLEDIGRYVKVYYKATYENEKKPGVTYCLVDDAKTVTLTENITAGETNQVKKFREAFGSKPITAFATVFENYAQSASTLTAAPASATNYNFDFASKTAAKGTYVIRTINNVDYVWSFVAPANTTVTKVTKVVDIAGKESITLSTIGTLKNTADEDVVVEYDGIAKDDIVTVVMAGNAISGNPIYTLSKVTTVEGKISKATNVKNDGVNYAVLTVGGNDYTVSKTNNVTTLLAADYLNGDALNNISKADAGHAQLGLNFNNTYKLYVDATGKCVGLEVVAGQADLGNVVYVVDVYEVYGNDTYGGDFYKVYAQGIDMEGKEVNYLVASAQIDLLDVDNDSNNSWDVLYDDGITELGLTYTAQAGGDAAALTSFVPDFYSFEKSNINKAANLGVMIPDNVAGIYNKVTAPLYTKATNISASSTDFTLSGKSTHVAITTDDGVNTAYLTANTKFLVYTGAQSTLTTAMTVGSITHDFRTYSGGTVTGYANAPVLLSRNADGNRIVEVMVIAKDPDSVVTGDYYYISAANAAKPAYTNDLGNVYVAYNAKGEEVTVTVNGSTPSRSFYQFATDADGVTTLTDIGTATDAKLNQTFDTIYNNQLVTSGINGIDHYDLTGAIIVDARDADLIESSDVYEITSIEDLMTLKSIDDADITLDVYVDSADEAVEIIFVTKVVAKYQPDNGETFKYVSHSTVNGEIIVVATKNDANGEEVKIVVNAAPSASAGQVITYNAATGNF